MLSWMLWLDTAAADKGSTLLPPCSKLWKASATASGATPDSAVHLVLRLGYIEPESLQQLSLSLCLKR